MVLHYTRSAEIPRKLSRHLVAHQIASFTSEKDQKAWNGVNCNYGHCPYVRQVERGRRHVHFQASSGQRVWPCCVMLLCQSVYPSFVML